MKGPILALAALTALVSCFFLAITPATLAAQQDVMSERLVCPPGLSAPASTDDFINLNYNGPVSNPSPVTLLDIPDGMVFIMTEARISTASPGNNVTMEDEDDQGQAFEVIQHRTWALDNPVRCSSGIIFRNKVILGSNGTLQNPWVDVHGFLLSE